MFELCLPEFDISRLMRFETVPKSSFLHILVHIHHNYGGQRQIRGQFQRLTKRISSFLSLHRNTFTLFIAFNVISLLVIHT